MVAGSACVGGAAGSAGVLAADAAGCSCCWLMAFASIGGASASGVACFAGSGSAGACAAGVAGFAGAGSAGAWAAGVACFAGAAGGAASAGVAAKQLTIPAAAVTPTCCGADGCWFCLRWWCCWICWCFGC